MKLRYTLALLPIALLTACGSGDEATTEPATNPEVDTTVSAPDTTVEVVEVEVDTLVTPPPSQFGIQWYMMHGLRNKFLQDLAASPNQEGVLLTNWLQECDNLAMQYDGILHEKFGEEELSKMTWKPREEWTDDQSAIHKEIVLNGFRPESGEGMLYLVVDGDYITDATESKLSNDGQRYVELYARELDKKCCADGGLMLTSQEVMERARQWGALEASATANEYVEIAHDQRISYLRMLFAGLDNTPAFDWDTETYNPESFAILQAELAQHPESVNSELISEYIALLEKNEMKRTEEVFDFLGKMWN